MATADYSERHYELAVNIELVRESNEYFVPSQNEEKGLGYDVALVPALPKVWSSLVEGLPGVGVATGPRIPRATSLFLQYKRPEFLRYRSALEATRREEAFGEHDSFYRFELPRAQLKVLIDLQNRFLGKATVCYAAGRFHKRTKFSSLKVNSTVTENSVFLTIDDIKAQLAALGHPPEDPSEDHTWTYDLNGSKGLLCSRPVPVEGLPFRALKENLRMRAGDEPLEFHVESLTTGVDAWRRESVEQERRHLKTQFETGLPQIDEVPEDGIERTPTMAIQETLDALGVGWFLAIPASRRGV